MPESGTRSLLLYIFSLLMLTSSQPGQSADMLYMSLWTENDAYHLRSASLIDAPPDLIFNTLLDYDNFYRISGGIKETRYLEPDADGTPVGLTVVESCVLIFCKRVKKTERINIRGTTVIKLEADPKRSDFKYFNSTWTVKSRGDRTLLTYDMDMQPDFWIPPLVGPWAIKRKLHSSAMHMASRLEKMAEYDIPLSKFNVK